MPLPRIRFTVRRWMMAVAVVAIFAASCIQLRKSYLWYRYTSASKEYSVFARYWAEGRITTPRYLEKAQRMMEAQIALCSDEQGRVACVEANLDLASSAMKELQEGPFLHGALAEIAETEEYIDQVRGRYGIKSEMPRNSEERDASLAEQ